MKRTKLNEPQKNLIHHLTLYPMMDYSDCLMVLDTAGTGDTAKLSYSFRPLTKNGYLAKHKDRSVTALAKGRALFPDEKQLISSGGGEAERVRVMSVARTAALLARNGIPSYGELMDTETPYFVPSARWRDIRDGLLSTTRFAGMLVIKERRLAVYDVGDGKMEWQLRAEASLFYSQYDSYETKATGMLLICNEEVKEKLGESIIRQTMWHRRQMASRKNTERQKPVAWSKSSIRMLAKYEHVYLTTPERLRKCLDAILYEDTLIQQFLEDGTLLHDPAQGDIERFPYRYFINPACDLLKYFFFFSASKNLIEVLENAVAETPLRYAICYGQEDMSILRMYPETIDIEGTQFYEYRSE